ncbi:hypothetical protein DF044_03845 [Burkholderia contaminans]|nr:hypothetical protein WI95_10365 [Burkholderia contaminans]RQT01561.1 hypothetical protein DF035_17865 [Burkholderia contaminans]RQT18329.1 hypothetical protein DF044_03845 [Burkholderia contaminans]TCW70120.1 hypothetical protein C5O79_12265 [Burkholderia sp. SRS-25]
MTLAAAGAQVLVHYGSGETDATAVVDEIRRAGGSERECLDPTSIFTVNSTANLFCWPAIATDRFRDVLT